MNAVRDLLLGVRLSFGTGRARGVGLLRTGLTAFGVGLAVAGLLLVFASFHGLSERLERIGARTPIEAKAGEPALGYLAQTSYYRGEELTAVYLEPRREDAPVPPGVDAVPAVGQAVVSPGLAGLLVSDEGALLRPRFADVEIVGTIGAEGVAEPGELWYYLGAEGLDEDHGAELVGGFGAPVGPFEIGPFFTVVFLVAGSILVSPLLVFIATGSRLAGADTERRLSALRLVGADIGQIRRIAAAESLIGAFVGLVLAVGFFFVGRPLGAGADLGGLGMYPQDLVPPWPLVVVVVLATPVITVGSALFGLRNVVVEPYGIVRESEPTRRRGWWRVTLVGVGVLLFLPDVWLGVEPGGTLSALFAGVGSFVLLVGVSVLMPWLVEWVVRRLRGGPPSWQLGVRRLQLDSGTPARVVAGITVVFAGAITVHTLFGGAGDVAVEESNEVHVFAIDEEVERTAIALSDGVPGVTVTGPGRVTLDPAVPDAVEHLRNALAPLGWKVEISREADGAELANTEGTLGAVLGTASTFTLLLAGGNLLVLTSAQVLQRRRAFAALRATGVPGGVLGRSLLWQNCVPMLIGVLLATAVGLGVAGLIARLFDQRFRPDWFTLAGYSAMVVLLVVAVTGASLPVLRAVVRETGLRGE